MSGMDSDNSTVEKRVCDFGPYDCLTERYKDCALCFVYNRCQIR